MILDNELELYQEVEDKLTFLTSIYSIIENKAVKHAKVCENPKTCKKTLFYKEFQFFIPKKIRELGISNYEGQAFNEQEKKKKKKMIRRLIGY